MRILRNENNQRNSGRTLPRLGARRPKTGLSKHPVGWRETVRAQFAVQFSETLPPRLLDRTLTEAEAIAFTTAVPELVFPVLAEEKLADAQRWLLRQQNVWERSADAFSA